MKSRPFIPDFMPNAEEIQRLQQIYPEFAPDQLEEAVDNWERYLRLCLRIHDRIHADPEAYQRFLALTGQKAAPTLKPRSNPPTS